MRKKGYKGRCKKKDLGKSQEVCRTYDAIQSTYADILQNDNSIQEIRCNVLMDGLAEGAYTSDFVCIKTDGDLMVRECVFRKFLKKTVTVKLLDASKDYWDLCYVVHGSSVLLRDSRGKILAEYPIEEIIGCENERRISNKGR